MKAEFNLDIVIKVAERLYYEVNPESNRDVPSIFYEKVEKLYPKWKQGGSKQSFYNYCKQKMHIK